MRREVRLAESLKVLQQGENNAKRLFLCMTTCVSPVDPFPFSEESALSSRREHAPGGVVGGKEKRGIPKDAPFRAAQ